MTEVRNRGTADVLIAIVVGLKRFPEAISTVLDPGLLRSAAPRGARKPASGTLPGNDSVNDKLCF